ncbi:conserved hypothetical protein [Caldicellulosiruptor hydrothermalis 108]|uniref:Uncharacterized protein n=1 Tax=Caldicellulosiruptor hydrothermalis (strain DSM 18901 / VKM B-2411 / 108) TaxID=632292 RepID=E4QBH3_CALH1|nr:Druantia anti-phage system protein DruA [Caldicellulosiruptor hydrothermalis]ADQ06075.1 conserved hypothetical protein [Caldicellulosiruptor hydrothermalis 108]
MSMAVYQLCFAEYTEVLKQEIIQEIEKFQKCLNVTDKESMRKLHKLPRCEEIKKHRDFLFSEGQKIINMFFADGWEVEPEKIDPVLIPVENDAQNSIFKTARFTWSLPYTEGYGRRLKFLVFDNFNGKLIGILGLQSPVLGLKARNEYLGLSKGPEKLKVLNRTMDIYTLGALPPYNFLLGGKLMVLAAVSNEIREVYRKKYEGKTTEIEGNNIDGDLVMLTTTSAYGRSSIYNRVKYKDNLICIPVGYTEGQGTLFLTGSLCEKAREYLQSKGVKVKSGYGNGPNYKFRLAKALARQLKLEGIEVELVTHGVQREVYVFPLIKNLQEYVKAPDTTEPEYFDYPFSDLASYWKERYCLPRSKRDTEWKAWRKEQVWQDIAKSL